MKNEVRRMKPENKLKIDAAFHAAHEVFGLPAELIQSESRKAEIVQAKRFIAHFLKWNTDLNVSAIARELKLNHATILHHNRKHFDLIETDKRYALQYEAFSSIASKHREPKTLDTILRDIEYKIHALLRERRSIKKMMKEFSA